MIARRILVAVGVVALAGLLSACTVGGMRLRYPGGTSVRQESGEATWYTVVEWEQPDPPEAAGPPPAVCLADKWIDASVLADRAALDRHGWAQEEHDGFRTYYMPLDGGSGWVQFSPFGRLRRVEMKAAIKGRGLRILVGGKELNLPADRDSVIAAIGTPLDPRRSRP